MALVAICLSGMNNESWVVPACRKVPRRSARTARLLVSARTSAMGRKQTSRTPFMERALDGRRPPRRRAHGPGYADILGCVGQRIAAAMFEIAGLVAGHQIDDAAPQPGRRLQP